VNWKLLAQKVVERRVQLGHPTRDKFAEASGLSARLLQDIEKAKRANYDAVTLARLEKALQWAEGRLQAILATPEPEKPSELQTPEGVARYLYRDDLVLVALIHRAGLNDVDLFKLILRVRAIRERQNAELLDLLAGEIRKLGGFAPEQVYPPTWLIDDEGEMM